MGKKAGNQDFLKPEFNELKNNCSVKESTLF